MLNENRYTVGPGIKAAIWAVYTVLMIAIGYALCYADVGKGIAEANLLIYRDDTAAKAKIDKEFNENTKLTQETINERPYETDCANMSIDAMRGKL